MPKHAQGIAVVRVPVAPAALARPSVVNWPAAGAPSS